MTDQHRCGNCNEPVITVEATGQMLQSQQGQQFLMDLHRLGGDPEGTLVSMCPACGSSAYISPPITVEATVLEGPDEI